MYNLNDVTVWAEEEMREADKPRAADLKRLMARLQRERAHFRNPATLPVGPERAVGEARRRRLDKKARSLGYLPLSEELAAEVGKEIVKQHSGLDLGSSF